MNYSQTSEFERELKAFAKKWRSIPDDLKKVQVLIENLYIKQKEVDLEAYREGIFNNKRAAILQVTDDGREVVKMRLDCASLGSKDILRLIFVYVKQGDTVTFIELYAKNDKSREDVRRISKYLG